MCDAFNAHLRSRRQKHCLSTWCTPGGGSCGLALSKRQKWFLQPLNTGRCKITASWPNSSSGNCFLSTGAPHVFFTLLASGPAANEMCICQTLGPLLTPGLTSVFLTELHRAVVWEGKLYRRAGNKALTEFVPGQATWNLWPLNQRVKRTTELPALPCLKKISSWAWICHPASISYAITSLVKKQIESRFHSVWSF